MNKMAKTLTTYIVSLVSCFTFVADSQAITHTSASCSLSDVAGAIDSANVDDIVTVPAGNCTWNSTLVITKGINLTGSGIGTTVINGNNLGENVFLIKYAPTADNQSFQISGFTFNVTNQNGLLLRTNSEPTTQRNIRIHHNRFTNSNISGAAIYNWGTFGVIDHNAFDAMRYPLRVGQSMTSVGENAWNNYDDAFHGTPDNIYVEDNTFSGMATAVSDCDQGGRYAFRYNKLNATGDMYPYFDSHEWGTSGYACMGVEIYGNVASTGYFLYSSQGAGRAIVHHNQVPGGVIKMYSDGDGSCTPVLPKRQPMNNYYLFQNRETATGKLLASSIGTNVCGTVVEDSSFWDDSPAFTFDGTRGVGSGALASRPATCTIGVGYWATDQSTVDLTGMVGADPSTPVRGKLYKCTSTNSWTTWYTPFTYPHPLQSQLRTSGYIQPPLPPQKLRKN